VKKLARLFLLLALAYSQTPPATSEGPAAMPSAPRAAPVAAPAASAPARTALTVATKGEPSDLRLKDGMLSFCDKRGRRKLDLISGRDTALGGTCPNNAEPNTACGGLSLDVAVRSPLTEPNDIVDLDGWSVPLKGRVHDCAADGKALAIVTASIVLLIDVTKRKTKEIGRQGGDRVTIDPGWVAWSKGSKLRVVSREP
jgi:hypothetical protein